MRRKSTSELLMRIVYILLNYYFSFCHSLTFIFESTAFSVGLLAFQNAQAGLLSPPGARDIEFFTPTDRMREKPLISTDRADSP